MQFFSLPKTRVHCIICCLMTALNWNSLVRQRQNNMSFQERAKMAFRILWLVWFVLLPISFMAIVVTGESHWNRFWWMSSAVLSLVAWLNGFLRRRERSGLFAVLIAIGMSFGTLADIYGAFSAIRFTEPLPMIIVLFSLGHVAYSAGLLVLATRLELTQRSGWKRTLLSFIAVYGLCGLGLWMILVHPSEDQPSMHLPVAVYTVFLATTGAFMATVAWLDGRFLALGIGAALFFVSDGLLGIKLFQGNWLGIGDLCWITYGIGQMLIVYGAIRAGDVTEQK